MNQGLPYVANFPPTRVRDCKISDVTKDQNDIPEYNKIVDADTMGISSRNENLTRKLLNDNVGKITADWEYPEYHYITYTAGANHPKHHFLYPFRNWIRVIDYRDKKYKESILIGYSRNDFYANSTYETSLYPVKSLLINRLKPRTWGCIGMKKDLYYFMKGKYMARSYDIVKTHKLPSNDVYIVKAIFSSRGRGTFVVDTTSEFKRVREIMMSEHKGKAVVCKYIDNPILVNTADGPNRKWHARIYFYITSWGTAHLHHTLRIMTAKSEYVKTDWTNPEIHDTHLKSTPCDYVWPVSEYHLPPIPIIMGIKKVFYEIAKNYHKNNNILEITDPTHDSNTISHTLAEPLPEAKFGYELFGMDILYDVDWNPWLLEVNGEPNRQMKTAEVAERFDATLYQFEYRTCISRVFDPWYMLAEPDVCDRLNMDPTQLVIKKEYLDNIFPIPSHQPTATDTQTKWLIYKNSVCGYVEMSPLPSASCPSALASMAITRIAWDTTYDYPDRLSNEVGKNAPCLGQFMIEYYKNIPHYLLVGVSDDWKYNDNRYLVDFDNILHDLAYKMGYVYMEKVNHLAFYLNPVPSY